MRYRSKPTEIEATHWNGRDITNELAFVAGDKVRVTGHGLELLAGKDGAQEWVPVPVGHWIVRQPGDESDIWPVDPDYFAAKYDCIDVPAVPDLMAALEQSLQTARAQRQGGDA